MSEHPHKHPTTNHHHNDEQKNEHHNCEHHHWDNLHELVFKRVIPKHNQIAAVLLKNALHIPLTYAQRQTPPHHVSLPEGSSAHLHIHEAVHVGDRLLAEVNQWAIVQAAVEPVLEVSGDTAKRLALCFEFGVKNWPIMLDNETIYVLNQTETQQYVQSQGLNTQACELAFTPIEPPRNTGHRCNHPEHQHDHNCDHHHHKHP